ncbi:MAG: hypothetical protein QNJ68_13690 [Microcoleaceae cyanobacterium MO_207.B10]|nr:hypothetical protein [Microcoleaceae cyanobacterium MO_207.B10]
MTKKRWLRYFKLTVSVATLTLVIGAATELLGKTSLPTVATPSTYLLSNHSEQRTNLTIPEYPLQITQRQVRPTDVWPFVYEKIPGLPLENDYVSKETGEVDTENTLISRLIRYHFYVKGRPPNFRFDWKLTLADYLGANDYLQSSVYPGHNDLTENPMEGDREAIQSLTRSQRETLVNRLVDIFSGDPDPPSIPRVQERSNPRQSSPRTPVLPQPGDADLLKL